MLSNAEKSRYRSLRQKKDREQSGLFVVDGIKSVGELLAVDFPVEKILLSQELSLTARQKIESAAALKHIPSIDINQAELEQISSLRHPEGVLAIARIPESHANPVTYPALYLWQINDPGNLGTIMRTALWFGIKTILLSPDSVDPYSPKVVRGSMGALFHLNFKTDVNFDHVYKLAKQDGATLWAADTTGSMEKLPNPQERFILIFGSESHGLPLEIIRQSDGVIGIKKYDYGESLNLAISAGIILHSICQQ